MPCYYPLDGWRAKNPNDSGKYGIVFTRQEAQQDCPMKIPCGRCIGCRLERSRQWAMRCTHEASMYDHNCFLTLTYDADNVPSTGSLNLEDFQRFMKRFRQEVSPIKIRFFMCGEYGANNDPSNLSTLGRPHYHAIIFNYDFPDRKFFKNGKSGEPMYISAQLDKVWQLGHATIGDCTFKSAGYVARYCMKKITGDPAEKHYESFNPETAEVIQLKPEFGSMSTKPGIGRAWFEKYRHDIDKGWCTLKGVKMAPPKYYNKLYKELYGDEYCFIEERKQAAIDPMDPEQQPDRLRVREKVRKIRTKSLTRNIQ